MDITNRRHIAHALRGAASALMAEAPEPVPEQPASKRKRHAPPPPGEKPDEYRARVGRCPRGYRWDGKACQQRTKPAAGPGPGPARGEDPIPVPKKGKKRQVATGDEHIDKQLQEALAAGGGKARSFADVDNAYQRDEMSSNSVSKLNDEERQAAEDYTGDSDFGYSNLNSHLRGNDIDYMDEDEKETLKTRAKALSSAIAKGVIPRDMNVYRGVSSRELRSFYDDMEVGQTMKTEGFWSSSMLKKVAEDFSSKGQNNHRVVLQINLPKGAKALPVSEISRYPNEAEVVLNHAAQFRMAKKQMNDDGILEVTLEYVGDGGL